MKTLIINYLTQLPEDLEGELRRLYVHLRLNGQWKKIFFTSSEGKEGTSFAAMNLWRLLARGGNRVVLIDADVRGSSLLERYRVFSRDGEIMGLSDYLNGRADLEDVLYQTNFQNGYLIPASARSASSEVLSKSANFRRLLARLTGEFDYVLVDAPSLRAAADGLLIANACDGTVLVTRSGMTPRRSIAASIQRLEQAECRLIGVVLNRVERKKKIRFREKRG